MNRNQFGNKFVNLNISQSELDRKYQVHLREQEEIQRMWEAAQALATSAPQATVGGGGGGGSNTLLGLYSVAGDGLLYSLDNFTNFPFNYLPFPSFPALCNGGDGYIYAVVDFGEISFLSINIATGDVLFYDNDISDFAQNGASSLYREESGSFIYVDNFNKKSAITNIIRITIDEPGIASATLVNSVDSSEPGSFFLKQLYLVDGSVWAISLAVGDFELTGPFDIDAGEFTEQPYEINTALKNEEPVIIDWITSCVQNNGIIYISAIYDSGSSIGLFRFDVEDGHPTWVKDGVFEVEGSTEYIWTLFNI